MMKSKSLLCMLLLWSCNANNKKEFVAEKPPQIPNIYISAASDKLMIHADTVYVENKLFSGFIYELDAQNNDTLSKSGYLDGLLSGLSQKWYKKNVLQEERFYINGAKNGKQIAYWANGKKKFDFTAQNDTYEGVLKEWNVNGDLIHLATFKDGQEEGTQKMWYDNGKIRANYIMRNGKRYGLLGTKNCVNVSDSIFVAK